MLGSHRKQKVLICVQVDYSWKWFQDMWVENKEEWTREGRKANSRVHYWDDNCCGQLGINKARTLWETGQIVPEKYLLEGWKRRVFILWISFSRRCYYICLGLSMRKVLSKLLQASFVIDLVKPWGRTWEITWFSQSNNVSLHLPEADCLSSRWSKGWAERIWAGKYAGCLIYPSMPGLCKDCWMTQWLL